MKKIFLIVLLTAFLSACNNNEENGSGSENSPASIPAPAVMHYSIVKVYPHDTSSYTQGLI